MTSQALQRSSDNAEDSSANLRQGLGNEAWRGKNAASPGRRRRSGGGGVEGSDRSGGGASPRKAAQSPMEGGQVGGKGKKASRSEKQVHTLFTMKCLPTSHMTMNGVGQCTCGIVKYKYGNS